MFDYLYYNLVKKVTSEWYGWDSEEFAGIVFLSTIQSVNVISILGLVKPKIFDTFLTFIGLLLAIFILNLIRYKKLVTYTMLSKKWHMESGMPKKLRRAGVLLYLITTVVFFFFSAFSK